MTTPVRPVVARLHSAGLLLLTASTGALDAVSYLALDGVFTGNMTGNVLFLGFGLVGAPDVRLLNITLALVGFALGSVVGGRLVGRGHPPGLPRRSAWLLGAGAALVVALAAAWAVVGHLGSRGDGTLTTVLAALMGAQVAAVKPVGNSDITTVVVTSTLANVTRDSRLAGGRQTRAQWLDRGLAVLAMGAGAALGASVLRAADGPAALVTCGVVLATGLAVLLAAGIAQRRTDA